MNFDWDGDRFQESGNWAACTTKTRGRVCGGRRRDTTHGRKFTCPPPRVDGLTSSGVLSKWRGLKSNCDTVSALTASPLNRPTLSTKERPLIRQCKMEIHLNTFLALLSLALAVLSLFGYGISFKNGIHLGPPRGIRIFKKFAKALFWIPDPFESESRRYHQPRFDPLGRMSVKFARLFGVKDDNCDVQFVRGFWMVVFLSLLANAFIFLVVQS